MVFTASRISKMTLGKHTHTGTHTNFVDKNQKQNAPLRRSGSSCVGIARYQNSKIV